MDDFSRELQALSLSDDEKRFVASSRKTIEAILKGEDPRLLLIVGPCSIHQVDSALEYANKLAILAKETEDACFIVMRAYMEKSRTSLGWRGFLSDPDGNGSHNILDGCRKARLFLKELIRLELPAATEFLDPVFSAFYSDLISWGSIGARTVESPLHRQLASFLPMPVGCKNRTDGNIDVAISAIEVARHAHTAIMPSSSGNMVMQRSPGNPLAHLVLRGGERHTNFDRESIARAHHLLRQKGLLDAILIDCSHGNAQKNYKNQKLVFEQVVRDIQQHEMPVRGLMLESFLEEGAASGFSSSFGKSITDPCLHFHETEALIRALSSSEVLV